MRALPCSLAVGLCSLCISVNAAHAATDVDAWKMRPASVSGTLGVGGPTGLLGGELEVAVLRPLVVGVGTGLGSGGMQVASWLRPRWVFDASALGVDVGASGGPYRQFAPFADGRHYAWAWWFNFALSYQYLADSGFAFRTFFGSAKIQSPSDSGGEQFFYGGVALGYAFLYEPRVARR